METSNDFIERLRASNGGCSDYRIAKLLGTDQTSVIRYTKHGKSMSDKYALRVAELLKIDPAYVLACMQAERSSDVNVTRQWERIASQYAASILLCLPLMSLIRWHF